MKAPSYFRIIGALGLSLAAFAAGAQSRPPTTEQLGKDPGALRQEAERQSAQERAQQQQSSQQQADQQWNDTVRRNQSLAAADAAQGEAVRRTWAQRPPLAPEQNPLLGRWQSLGAGQRGGNAAGLPPELAKMAAELIGGITSGMCDSMLGRGTIEFRPAGVFAIGADGRERAMYRAEYRGGGSRVVVLPQGGTTFTHMIIDFSGHDRATVAAVGCGLARAGGGGGRAAMGNASPSADAGGAGGEVQWKLLATTPTNGGIDGYVARSTIRRSGATAQMSDLYDFKTPQFFERRPFLSARNQFEYDCARARRRMLSTTGYSGHMGQGSIVAADASLGVWAPVGDSGVFRDYWKVACAKE
jgi:hypothetical protein